MPSPTPRQTRRARRLQSIKDAALDLVVEDGLDGFSVHKLADRVDLTAGALYRYFESRDEMLIAVQAEVLAVFDRYLQIVLERVADQEILDQLVVMCRAYDALADLQPQRFQLNAQFVAAPRPVFDANAVEATAERTRQMLGRLAVVIARAQTEGQLRDGSAGRRAVVAWSSVHALIERRKLERLEPEMFEPKALMDELLLTLLVGWGASLKAAKIAVDKELQNDMLRAAMETAEAQHEEEVDDV